MPPHQTGEYQCFFRTPSAALMGRRDEQIYRKPANALLLYYSRLSRQAQGASNDTCHPRRSK
ncbi:MAG: hypothetical protein ACPIOQ_66680, partial [Promethearchaeia archaeon]